MKWKYIILYLFVLVFCIPQAIRAETPSEAFKRWTYRLSKSEDGVGRIKIDCTLIGEDLIETWLNDKQSLQSKDRINFIYHEAVENGIFVFLINFRMKSTHPAVYADFSNISNGATLYITDSNGSSNSPAYYSGNMNQPMSAGQNYYGLLAFKTTGDAFSFQTLTLKGKYINRNIQAYNNRRNPRYPRPCCTEQQFQFSFLPYGVSKSDRPNSSSDMDDVFGMLQLAIKIMTKLL